MKQHETALQAVVRKAQEEIGITINQSHLHLAHTMHRKSIDTTIIILFFRITEWEGVPYNKAVDKYEHIAWCNHNEMPDAFMPADLQALEFIAQAALYSEHGW